MPNIKHVLILSVIIWLFSFIITGLLFGYEIILLNIKTNYTMNILGLWLISFVLSIMVFDIIEES